MSWGARLRAVAILMVWPQPGCCAPGLLMLIVVYKRASVDHQMPCQAWTPAIDTLLVREAKPDGMRVPLKPMAAYLIQILLPRVGTNREPVGDSRFAETRQELVDTFGGVTAYLRAPAQGAWTAPDGHVERDEVVMVEVLSDAFDRAWWRSFSAMLAKRFHQESIHVRALPIETP